MQLREAAVVYRPLALSLEGAALGVGEVHRESVEFGQIARAWIGERAQEHVIAFALDVDMRILAVTTVGIGSGELVRLQVPDMLRFLLAAGGTALVLAHNHPSGGVDPSPEDLVLTLEVARGCEAIGSKLLDHVIVGAGSRRVYSFHDQGAMP